MHVESRNDWTIKCDIKITNKFRGQYIEIQPIGTFHLEFSNSGHYYTWNKAKSYVNNILFGKLWTNIQGDETIINHITKDTCNLKYWPCNFFSTDSVNKVTGIIKDSNKIARYVLDGVCTEKLEYAPVVNSQTVKNVDDIKKFNQGQFKLIWKRFNNP